MGFKLFAVPRLARRNYRFIKLPIGGNFPTNITHFMKLKTFLLLVLAMLAYTVQGQTLRDTAFISRERVRALDSLKDTRIRDEWRYMRYCGNQVKANNYKAGYADAFNAHDFIWPGPVVNPINSGYDKPTWAGHEIELCAHYGAVKGDTSYMNAALRALLRQCDLTLYPSADISRWPAIFKNSVYTEYAGAPEGRLLARHAFALNDIIAGSRKVSNAYFTTAKRDTILHHLTRGANMLVVIVGNEFNKHWPAWASNNIAFITPTDTGAHGLGQRANPVTASGNYFYRTTVNSTGGALAYVGGPAVLDIHLKANNRTAEKLIGILTVAYLTNNSSLKQACRGAARIYYKYSVGPGGVFMEYADRDGDRGNRDQGVFYSGLTEEWLTYFAEFEALNGSLFGYTYSTKGGYAGSIDSVQGKSLQKVEQRQVWHYIGYRPRYFDSNLKGIAFRIDFTDRWDSAYYKYADGSVGIIPDVTNKTLGFAQNVKLQYYPYAAQTKAISNRYYKSDTLKRIYSGTFPGMDLQPKPPYDYARAGNGMTYQMGGGMGVSVPIYTAYGGSENYNNYPSLTPTLRYKFYPGKDTAITYSVNLRAYTIKLADQDSITSIQWRIVAMDSAGVKQVDNRYPSMRPVTGAHIATVTFERATKEPLRKATYTIECRWTSAGQEKVRTVAWSVL